MGDIGECTIWLEVTEGRGVCFGVLNGFEYWVEILVCEMLSICLLSNVKPARDILVAVNGKEGGDARRELQNVAVVEQDVATLFGESACCPRNGEIRVTEYDRVA